MPIYEFACRACGKETERLQKLSEPDLLDCPHCGKPALQRTVSAAGFRLSGSGWYETDFKKDGKRNLTGDSSGASAKISESGDTGSKADKSESKPASDAKPESKPKPKTQPKTKSSDTAVSK